MRATQRKAWAENTLKSISSEWNAFKEFARLANILYLPIENWVICFFAQWLIYTGRIKSPGSLAQYVSAVRTVHKMLNLKEIPTPSQFGPLDLILKGFRREAQHPTKKSLPITLPILKLFKKDKQIASVNPHSFAVWSPGPYPQGFST